MKRYSLTKSLPIVSILEREFRDNLWKTLDSVKNRDKVNIVDMQNVYKPFTALLSAHICVVLRVGRVALQRA